MTIVYPVTLCVPSMTYSCILGIAALYKFSSFFSAFNTLSYSDMSVLVYLFWYVNSNDFKFSFGLTLSPSSGIALTGILSFGSYVGILSSSIPGTKSSLWVSRKKFRVSAGSVIFHSTHLISLFIMNLLV